MSTLETAMPDDAITPLKTPPLASPEHGNGLLYRGGLPGNRGGTGRPPSAIREAMRTVLGERLGVLVRIADDPSASPSDRIRALEVLARYGLGTHDATEHTVPVLLSAAERDARLRVYVAQLQQGGLMSVRGGDPSDDT